jgi:hypothetical protein
LKKACLHICSPLLFFISLLGFKYAAAYRNADTTVFSTRAEAIAFLDKQTGLENSKRWPKIPAKLFLDNLRKNVENPLGLYEGRSTNFCAYAALSYLPLHDDPLTFVRFMINLYKEGHAVYGREYFEPSKEIHTIAGGLSFKGELDIRPADQLWFLSLADHFKGYLNLLDHHYNNGDENKMWAAVNFAKFNRMIRKLFNYQVDAIGSDLIRPGIRDIFEYLSERLQKGRIALFVNNLDLYKKNHNWITLQVPTHFIILLNIREVDDKIAITYWDYGGKTLQLVTPKFLKKIIFGIADIQPKKANAE